MRAHLYYAILRLLSPYFLRTYMSPPEFSQFTAQKKTLACLICNGGAGGIRTHARGKPSNDLANRPLQPLEYRSKNLFLLYRIDFSLVKSNFDNKGCIPKIDRRFFPHHFDDLVLVCVSCAALRDSPICTTVSSILAPGFRNKKNGIPYTCLFLTDFRSLVIGNL